MTTMISAKLAVLMATIAVLGVAGVAAPMTTAAYAQNGQAVIIDRSNSISQNIEQEQEACTNEVEVEADERGKGNQKVKVNADQSNECLVFQEQNAQNNALIDDDSENLIIGANIDLELLNDILNGLPVPQ